MSMYELFQSDANAEVNGIVVDYTTFRVTLARAGGANKKYKRLLNAALKPYQRLIQMDSFTNEQADDVFKMVYSKAVVLNWEIKVDDKWVVGIESPEGETLPVTPANVLGVFEAIPDLYLDIRDQAMKAALYRVALREEAEGNL